jgi:predicted nucleic acid-binding Zn ribbon protein
MDKTCIVCGCQIINAKRSTAKYCSDKCKEESNKALRLHRQRLNRLKDKIYQDIEHSRMSQQIAYKYLSEIELAHLLSEPDMIDKVKWLSDLYTRHNRLLKTTLDGNVISELYTYNTTKLSNFSS